MNLHSTMVLFKSFISRSVSSASISFTFHYGPIQILEFIHIFFLSAIYIPLWSYSNLISFALPLKTSVHLHSTMVLFKCIFRTIPVNRENIYIPLWSYSNLILVFIKVATMCIYIPLWSYSNKSFFFSIT